MSTARRFTFAGCLQGARLTLPLLPGMVVFASAFGTAAAQKGLTLAQTVGVSAFVFAGASQMVGLELWREVWSLSTLLALMTVTAIINPHGFDGSDIAALARRRTKNAQRTRGLLSDRCELV